MAQLVTVLDIQTCADMTTLGELLGPNVEEDK